MAISTKLCRCRWTSSAILLVASVSLAPTAIPSQGLHQIETPIVGADDLALHWEYYEGDLFDIVGRLECPVNEYCDFCPSYDQRKIVWVDIRNLDNRQKRRLTLDCRSSCETTIKGYVGLAMVLAFDVGETASSR
jgi:hypothetical protein